MVKEVSRKLDLTPSYKRVKDTLKRVRYNFGHRIHASSLNPFEKHIRCKLDFSSSSLEDSLDTSFNVDIPPGDRIECYWPIEAVERAMERHVGPVLERLDSRRRTDYTYSQTPSYRQRTPTPSRWENPQMARRSLHGGAIDFIVSRFVPLAAASKRTGWSFYNRLGNAFWRRPPAAKQTTNNGNGAVIGQATPLPTRWGDHQEWNGATPEFSSDEDEEPSENERELRSRTHRTKTSSGVARAWRKVRQGVWAFFALVWRILVLLVQPIWWLLQLSTHAATSFIDAYRTYFSDAAAADLAKRRRLLKGGRPEDYLETRQNAYLRTAATPGRAGVNGHGAELSKTATTPVMAASRTINSGWTLFSGRKHAVIEEQSDVEDAVSTHANGGAGIVGAGIVGAGAGASIIGAGAGVGASIVGAGAGIVRAGAGIVRAGAGIVGAGAGIVGAGAGVVAQTSDDEGDSGVEDDVVVERRVRVREVIFERVRTAVESSKEMGSGAWRRLRRREGRRTCCALLPCWMCLPILLLLLVVPWFLYGCSNETRESVRQLFVPIPFILLNRTRDVANNTFVYLHSFTSSVSTFVSAPRGHTSSTDGGAVHVDVARLEEKLEQLQAQLLALSSKCCKEPPPPQVVDLSRFATKDALQEVVASMAERRDGVDLRLAALDRSIADLLRASEAALAATETKKEQPSLRVDPHFVALRADVEALRAMVARESELAVALRADVLREVAKEGGEQARRAEEAIRAELAIEVETLRRQMGVELAAAVAAAAGRREEKETPSVASGGVVIDEAEIDRRIASGFARIVDERLDAAVAKFGRLEAQLRELQDEKRVEKERGEAEKAKVDANLLQVMNMLRGGADEQAAALDEIREKIRALEVSDKAAVVAGAGMGCKGCATIEQLNELIAVAIRKFELDKTGMADFALETSGGTVISTRCSETYAANTRVEKVFGIPLWYSSNSPRTAIQPGLVAGQCWAFRGFPGHLVVRLSGVIAVSAVSYEHLAPELSPDGHIESAPKRFQVFGLQEENDVAPVLLGDFVYDNTSVPLQFFSVQAQGAAPVPIIELRVLSNYGHPTYTCLYRFRVHGRRIRPAYGG